MRAIKKDDLCRPLNKRIISQNVQKINIKPTKKVGLNFWQPQLDDFRTLLLRDYDEIVRNINELSEWIENNK